MNFLEKEDQPPSPPPPPRKRQRQHFHRKRRRERERERERDSRIVRDREKGLDDDDDTSTRPLALLARREKKERKFSNSSRKKKKKRFPKRPNKMGERRAPCSRHHLRVLSSKSSSIFARVFSRRPRPRTVSGSARVARSSFRSCIKSQSVLRQRQPVSLVLILRSPLLSFFLSFVHTNNNSLALYFFCPQCKPSRFCKRRCRSLPLRLLRALECFSRVTQRHRGQETTVCVIRRLKMETFLYPIALDFRLFVPNNRTFSPRFLKP